MRKSKQPNKRDAKPTRQSTITAKRSGDHLGGRYNSTIAAMTFVVGASIATFLFFADPYLVPFEAYWLVNAIMLLWIPLMVILLFFKAEPGQFGLSAGEKGFGLKFSAVAILFMLPIVFYASQMAGFRATYGWRLNEPMNWLGQLISPCLSTKHQFFQPGDPIAVHSILALVYYELGMGFYLFCWEFFYRGFLLFGLAKIRRLGNVGAVIAQTIPFTILHWSIVPSAAKPMPEIISAFFGGLILGALAIRTRSFFYGFLIHWVIALAMDAFVIAPQLFRL